ncbi:MAG: glycoside hydrolase family 20 zincin-like fold domain-containing protein [Bacteroidota bacterium]
MIAKTINLSLVICGIFLSMFLHGQNQIPAPKEVVHKSDYFSIDQKLRVKNSNASEDNSNLLNDFLRSITNVSNIDGKHLFIHLKKTDSLSLKKTIEENNLNSGNNLGNEGYILNIDNRKIEILALEDAGIFYGIQTLRQLFNNYRKEKKIPCMVIYDKPDIAIRAWQDDISRGPIPTLATLKKQIEIMSSFKLNYFTLYTEHVFKLDQHPTIAPVDGITKVDLEELSAFAEKYHVTLIGNYQSFGHMKKTLSNPKYTYLAENDHIISPAMEESYEFLEDVYSEMVPLYKGEYFNINCDETFGLGEGKSKAMVDSIGIPGIYAYHINRLDKILKKYNKKILMWGDIATSHPEIISALPKDMTVMAWGYHPAKSFDYAIEPIIKRQLNFWVAPGVSCWSNGYPNLKHAEINIYNFIRDGYKFNTKGVLNTSWDDDGLNFFNYNWHGFAWGAENSWNAPANLSELASDEERVKLYKQFNKAFDVQFYGLLNNESITALMHEFSSLHQSNIKKVLKNERFFEGIFPIHLDYIRTRNKEKNKIILDQLDAIRLQLEKLKHKPTRNGTTQDYLIYSVNQTRFTIKKNLFRIALYQYLYEETAITEIELETTKGELVNELEKLKTSYILLWNNENRPHWLSHNIEKFDKLIKSLEGIGNHVLIEPLNEVNEKGRKVSIRTVFNDYPIYFSINADTVNSSSTLFKAPFYLKEDAVIQAVSYDGKSSGTIQNKDLLYHKAIGKLHQLSSTYSNYHPSYDGGGEQGLLDGQIGTKDNLKSGKWQGYSGQNIELEIAYSANDVLHSFSMGFFQNTESWVIFPKQVEIYIKSNLDGDYQLYRTIKSTIPPEEKGNLKQLYTTDLGDLKTKYMKVVAQYYGKLPEWHKAGSKYESMIFADEIIIK